MDEKKLAAIHRSISDIEQRMKRTQNDLFKDSLLCDMIQKLAIVYPEETRKLVGHVLLRYNGYSEEVIEEAGNE